MLSRRKFLGIAGGVAVGGAVGGRVAWSALLDEHLDAVADQRTGSTSPGTMPFAPEGGGATTGRILVVIQMSGGNDGLNTLVPVGDGRYFDARPTLRVNEADALRLKGADRFGLHPALQPLVAVWDRGELAAIEAIGFPDQSRSHFAAMDTWWSATPGQSSTTGWLGRWLDTAGDPTNPLRALALGGGSPALTGTRSLATVVRDPAAFALRTPKGADAKTIRDAFLATAEPLSGDPVEAAAQAAVPASLEAVDLLARAAGEEPDDGGARGLVPQATKGGNAYGVTELLQTAAGIIDLGIGTQVILVAGDGFDTHSDQAGRHPELLSDLAGGLAGFLDTLRQKGHADRVMVVTTSEFGRRVQENGSGTDHGDGGVQFLAGPMVKGGQVIGDADLAKLNEGDLRSTIDSRSLYANALDWLSSGDGSAEDVLGATYDRYGLLTR
jgi:uncharacterized protein (DUF1501 family)